MLSALQGLSWLGAALHIGGSVLIVYGQTIVKVGHCIEDSSPYENSWLLPGHATATPLWWAAAAAAAAAAPLRGAPCCSHAVSR